MNHHDVGYSHTRDTYMSGATLPSSVVVFLGHMASMSATLRPINLLYYILRTLAEGAIPAHPGRQPARGCDLLYNAKK